MPINETEADMTGVPARVSPKPEVEKIGDRKLKPSTLMMGHGYDPSLSEGSLKPPIFLTSTFVFPNAAAGVGRIEALGLDTYANEDRFFSYRRATHRGEPSYGRQIAIIGLPNPAPVV